MENDASRLPPAADVLGLAPIAAADTFQAGDRGWWPATTSRDMARAFGDADCVYPGLVQGAIGSLQAVPRPIDAFMPRFELVSLASLGCEDGEVPRVVDAASVPRSLIGRTYRAAEAVSVVDDHERGRMLRFGSAGLTGSICIDMSTGEIVEIQGPAVRLVNSGLSRFNEAVRLVSSMFPFYGKDDLDLFDGAAVAIRFALEGVDPECTRRDGFWDTFIWDVAIGDYATELLPDD